LAESPSTQKTRKWPRKAKGGGKKACTIAECKRPYRAKGYCYFHFKKWRQGELPHTRYRVCSNPECRAKAVRHGLCEKHFDEAYKAAAPGAPKAEAAAAPAAAPAPTPAEPAPSA
jgi:hypothetical protein